MGGKKRRRRVTLADALDLTRWDFKPGADRKVLFEPVGTVFADLPWEIRPQYLGPAPIRETKVEDHVDDDEVDTQPIEKLED